MADDTINSFFGIVQPTKMKLTDLVSLIQKLPLTFISEAHKKEGPIYNNHLKILEGCNPELIEIGLEDPTSTPLIKDLGSFNEPFSLIEGLQEKGKNENHFDYCDRRERFISETIENKMKDGKSIITILGCSHLRPKLGIPYTKGLALKPKVVIYQELSEILDKLPLHLEDIQKGVYYLSGHEVNPKYKTTKIFFVKGELGQ